MIALGIDPGPVNSAFILYDEPRVIEHGTLDNRTLMGQLRRFWSKSDHLAIEMIASYGMAVGREVFETCFWIGRIVERWDYYGGDHTLVYRIDVKKHVCKNGAAKDTNIRTSLLDRFGPGKAIAVGTTKKPGPLFGVTGDEWAALGVAVTYSDGAVPVYRSEPA